jgi:GTPase SAR1 family protein
MDSIHNSIITTSDKEFKRASLRVVLSGPKKAGKTQFFKTYKNDPNDPFTSDDLDTDYSNPKDNVYNKVLQVDQGRINLALWDLAGEATESVRLLTKNFFRDSDGVFLLFDSTDPESFRIMEEEWLPFIDNTLGFNMVQSNIFLIEIFV